MAGDQHVCVPSGGLPGNRRDIADLRFGVPASGSHYTLGLARQAKGRLSIPPYPGGLNGSLPWPPNASGCLDYESSKLRRALDPGDREFSADGDSSLRLGNWATPSSEKQGALPPNALRQPPASTCGIHTDYGSTAWIFRRLQAELALVKTSQCNCV